MNTSHLFVVLFFVLVSLIGVSSRRHHLSGHDDVFEDAILEHLRDIQEEDEAEYYTPEEIENEEDDEHDLTKKQLIEVLDAIRKEARKRQEHRKSEKRTVNNNNNNDINDKKTEKHNKILNKRIIHDDDDTENKDTHVNKENKKKEVVKILQIHEDIPNKKEVIDKIQQVKRGENDQVASVVLDNSLEKENELINKIDLRNVLAAKDGGSSSESLRSSPPKPAHIKQQNTKEDKAGLDHVSFIAVVAGCCVAAVAGLALAAYCWYKLRVENKGDAENPKDKRSSKKTKKDVKEEKPLSKDDEMNVNAEYYNYQHAKNQIKQMGLNKPMSEKFAGDETSEDEDDETVYECPGPGAPGDMKVVNPMFSDGESRHSDKTSHDGSPTPPNERNETVTNNNN